MAELLWVFVGGVVISALLTPLVRMVSQYLGTVGPRDARTPVNAPPRLGGVAIVVAWTVVMVTVDSVDALPIVPLLSGSLLVWAIGLIDDLRPVPAGVKIAVEALAASAVIGAGLVIAHVTVFDVTVELGWVSSAVTLGWLIAITNAFNLLDGLDGLATGLAIIAGVTCAAIAVVRSDMATAVVLVALVGALVGFLPFNFNPASIFLGDSGSLFIGFVLAWTAITGSQKGATALAAGVPLLIFALPLLDMASAVVRRLRGAAPVSGRRLGPAVIRLLRPDTGHIHHQLLSRGLSHRSAVLVLYAVAICLSVMAFVLADPR